MSERKFVPNVRLYKRVKIDGKWTMRAIGLYSPNRDIIVLNDQSVFDRTRPGRVNKARRKTE
jgi:hypothetical protein